jgi:hypothetical protein
MRWQLQGKRSSPLVTNPHHHINQRIEYRKARICKADEKSQKWMQNEGGGAKTKARIQAIN